MEEESWRRNLQFLGCVSGRKQSTSGRTGDLKMLYKYDEIIKRIYKSMLFSDRIISDYLRLTYATLQKLRPGLD